MPFLDRWRTFILASGAFPENLTGFMKNQQHTYPRSDWEYWRAQIDKVGTHTRIPTYSDYTTQHPVFQEPVPGANPSASIRYTSDHYWVIMRGEGLRNPNGAGYQQWPANAQLLCKRPEYCDCGPDFSYGDNFIYKTNLQSKNPGNAETWLRAGVNHHITFTIRQIANQFGT